MKAISDSNIVICGIVRDAERGLKANIPVINRICDTALDYKVIIFENSSVDKTKEILTSWAESRKDKVSVHCSDIDTDPGINLTPTVNPFFSARRINKMVKLRNQYLDYLAEAGMIYDYLIVVDLDVARIDFDGIISSFKTREDWDAITAYGHSLSPKLKQRYHDTYALRELGDDAPQTEEKILLRADSFTRRKIGRNPIPVRSAFGGLAIYRAGVLAGVRYSLIYNNDPRVEVLCEHESIYRQMREKGYDRVFINPSMKIKYQRLTWKIISRSIRFRFK
ncbi:MAG: glycosyltransferase family 69 protein [Bacteroidales bacterium]|nr:glycosyltransferase family 69 protein [Bacteroidales bacterium]